MSVRVVTWALTVNIVPSLYRRPPYRAFSRKRRIAVRQ
jgi:hypothetical protein